MPLNLDAAKKILSDAKIVKITASAWKKPCTTHTFAAQYRDRIIAAV
jgi:hypothetical protein